MRIYTFYHSELMTSEAPEVIKAKVEKLDALKEEYYALNEKRFKLEEIIQNEEKELSKIRGVLYDYTDEPEQPKETCPTEKVNLVLKGLSNSKF